MRRLFERKLRLRHSARRCPCVRTAAILFAGTPKPPNELRVLAASGTELTISRKARLAVWLRPGIFPRMKNIFTASVAAALMLGLSACAGKKGDQYAGVDGDYVLGTPLPDRVDGANFFGSGVDRAQFSPIYFGYDSFIVEDAELAKLNTVAAAAKKLSKDIIIAGFTDIRGTEEYNRGLGERRAQAVRDALIGMGVNGARLQTVSFGGEMPADPGSGEEAWAKNRRAEFGVVR